MVKIKEEIKTAFIVEMSNKRDIQIDQDELSQVVESIKSGNSVKVKQGIFNPSFYVDIVLDEKRITKVIEENKLRKFEIEQGTKKPLQLQPLKDIFKEVKLLEKPN